MFLFSNPAELFRLFLASWNRKGTPFVKIKKLNITKLRIISYKLQIITHLQGGLINFEIILSLVIVKFKKMSKKVFLKRLKSPS